MEVANSSLRALIFHYHALVTEFTKKLLVAKEYYSQSSLFWINNSLVADKITQHKAFATACTAISDLDGLSSQDAIQTLFESYIYFISSLRLLLSLLAIIALFLRL